VAFNAYLNCESIKGESTDQNHPDWIEVVSFSHSLNQPTSGTNGTGGRGAGRVDFASFVITKSVDKASVDFNIFCAKGTHIPKVILEICQETGQNICYLRYELENVMIQSVSTSGDSSGRPHETIAFVYDKISWAYTLINNDGSAGTTVGPKKWNIEINTVE